MNHYLSQTVCNLWLGCRFETLYGARAWSPVPTHVLRNNVRAINKLSFVLTPNQKVAKGDYVLQMTRNSQIHSVQVDRMCIWLSEVGHLKMDLHLHCHISGWGKGSSGWWVEDYHGFFSCHTKHRHPFCTHCEWESDFYYFVSSF